MIKSSCIFLVMCLVVPPSICIGESAALSPRVVEDEELLDAQQTERFLADVKEELGGIKTLRADFVQERHMRIFEEPLVAKGTIYYKAPAALRWELREPYSSVLLYSEGELNKWVLDNDRRREINLASQEIMRQVIGMIIEWMRGDLEKSREHFNLTVAHAPESYQVELKPRVDALGEMIGAIELVMDEDDFQIESVCIEEAKGDRVEIRYIEKEWNIELVQELFEP